ncbi:MAG: glyoxalase superfamily protein [Pseudomonadota bacterium]
MKVPLQSCIPVLRVADYLRARAFWRDSLGFTVTEEGGDPPRFGIFHRNRAEVFLDAWHGADPPRPAGWRVYFHIPDADAMAAELRAAGIALKRGPEDAPYGLREIDIEDPDGNCRCFGQILEAGASG